MPGKRSIRKYNTWMNKSITISAGENDENTIYLSLDFFLVFIELPGCVRFQVL